MNGCFQLVFTRENEIKKKRVEHKTVMGEIQVNIQQLRKLI